MPSMMHVCNELGSIALGKGDYKEARKQFRCMVKESRKHGMLEQAGAQNRLGFVCMREHRYEEAEDCFRKCLELCEKLYGPSHPELATQLSNLGVVIWQKSGNATEARPLFEKAVLMLEEAMPFTAEFEPAKRESYARAFENYAGLLEKERDYDTAEQLYRKALEIKIEAVGECSPGVFQTAYTLSQLYRKAGRIHEANEITTRFLPAAKSFASKVNDEELKTCVNLLELFETDASH
jgi:tetratricopeptide (TPR) repeat protein